MLLCKRPGRGQNHAGAHFGAKLQRPIPAGFRRVFRPVNDIREAIEKAEIALQQGQATILFVDEVHRFNKAQQDAFLPHVEKWPINLYRCHHQKPLV